jgi:excinuclease ABC subunit B
MKAAIDETYRRRALQIEHNERNGIVPRGIVKEIKDITDRVRAVAEEHVGYATGRKPGIISEIPRDELVRMVKELESQMKAAARDLEFEKAALLRDQIIELRRITMVDPVLS